MGLSSIFSLAGTKNGSGYGPGHHRKKAAELIKSGSPGQSVGLRPKPGRGNEQLEELMVGGGGMCGFAPLHVRAPRSCLSAKIIGLDLLWLYFLFSLCMA